jgi:catechol 2,3-dioxygenase-like lactoylglutathione lyase family enzyme
MVSTCDRRRFLAALPLLGAMPRLLAQPAPPPFKLRTFNHVTLTVSDLQRSIDFYQGLFGLPVQSRQGSETAALRIGSGPQHLGLSTNPSSGVRTPRIDHMCIGLDRFDLDGLLQYLAAHGVPRSEQRGAMRVQVRMRNADSGGAASGTPEVYLGDPDGVILQLQDATYCAGSGPLGNVCSAGEPVSKKGLIAPKAYSHCTVFSTDPQRSNRFYQELFATGTRSYQGPAAPTLAVGPGVEFLMMAGGGANSARQASINHFCLSVEGFDTSRLIQAFESFGIKPRESQTGPVPPLRHYVSMRMENRGGAKEGTPELYFTDPDGLLVQLQDVSYCGGSGVLGSVCPQS